MRGMWSEFTKVKFDGYFNKMLVYREGGVCGERITAASASIPMVHTIPDLHVSESVSSTTVYRPR